MIKSKKVLNNMLIISFLTIIILPLFFINRIEGKVAEGENRYLKGFPTIFQQDGSLNRSLPREIESWLNDNIGFRDQIIKINTVMQYKLFNKSAKQDTFIGKDSWLYYYTNDILRDYQNLNIPTQQELTIYSDNLEKLSEYFKEQNIPTINMMLLDKKTIYPEYYPDSIRKVGEISKTDLLIEKFTENTNINFFTPLEDLLRYKKEALVYPPAADNAHWNIYGAFVGYRALMKKVEDYVPGVKILDFSDFNISKYEEKVKFNNAIEFNEESYSFQPKYELTVFEGPLEFWDDMPNLENQHYRYINNDSRLPKMLIIGDSYLYGQLLPIIAESFSELIFIHSSDIEYINNYVDKFKPDVVVYEFVERMFDGAMNSLQQWVERGSQKSFSPDEIYEVSILPEKESFPELYYGMYLGYSNNEPVNEQGVIKMNSWDDTLKLNGIAADFITQMPAGDLYVQVGETVYKASYGESRPDIAEFLNNTNYTNTGFNCVIDTKDILKGKVDEISFIIVSNDKSFKYAPVKYKIEIQQ